MRVLRIFLFTIACLLVCLLAISAHGQAIQLPAASDHFWKTPTGIDFAASSDRSAKLVYGELPDSPKPKESSSTWQSDRPANTNFWIGAVVTASSAAAPVIGGNICRHNNGVEPCTEHYGAYNLWVGLTSAATVFAGPALFYGCRKENHNARFCWLIPAVIVGANVGWGIHEARINRPDVDERGARR